MTEPAHKTAEHAPKAKASATPTQIGAFEAPAALLDHAPNAATGDGGDPAARPVVTLGDPRLLQRMSMDQRARLVRQLQRGHGNGHVARMIERGQFQLEYLNIWRKENSDNSQTGNAFFDSEGNPISSAGGHHYLTNVPQDIEWHQGKAEALPPNPKAKYAELYARCKAICAEQLTIANSLRGDMKYWFAKVYHLVTKHELMQIDARVYEYPLMKMQEVIAFHTTYEQNLQRWQAGNKNQVESNWRVAFSAAEDAQSIFKTKAMEIMDALLPSMQAHIRFDLPRAIAACFESNYGGIPGLSLADFHRDYTAMAPVFDAAQADLLPEIDEATRWMPSIGPGLDPTNWHWAQSLGFPVMFLTSREREHSWEKASDIVSGHTRGIVDQRGMQRRLRTYAKARHPLSDASDFEVDDNGLGDEEIRDYDWNHQPS